MICYVDTSALVPLLIAEPTSPACRRVWDDADTVVTSRLAYVEAAAALAQAERMGRVTTRQQDAALALLATLWDELDVVEPDRELIDRAARLARALELRGYDAMHAAAAEQLADPEFVAAAGDRRLLRAWSGLGLATYDTTQPANP